MRTQLNKKAQTINISHLRGDHTPQPIDMTFGVLSGVPDVIFLVKFYSDRLRGFCGTAPQTLPFRILI